MIKTYKKDGRKLYEVYVMERDAHGKQISRRKRGLESERDAKEVEFQFKSELRGVTKANAITWEMWHAKTIERYSMVFRASTVANYDGYLKKYIPSSWLKRDLRSITKSEVYDLIDRSKTKLGETSQKNILKMLRKLFEEAIAEGYIERNPTAGIVIKSTQAIKKVLTTKEVEILLKEAKFTNHEYYPIWAFAVLTGMRSGEMYATRWSDVDMAAGIISVSRQWTSKDGFHELKTGDWRVVPISSDLRSLLLELSAKYGMESSAFVLPHPNSWTRGMQAGILRTFCDLAGITSVKFHDLRATFITNMLAQGVSLVRVMSIVGHRKMETTDEYLRLAGVEVKGATDSLGYSLPKEEEVFENVISIEFGRK